MLSLTRYMETNRFICDTTTSSATNKALSTGAACRYAFLILYIDCSFLWFLGESTKLRRNRRFFSSRFGTRLLPRWVVTRHSSYTEWSGNSKCRDAIVLRAYRWIDSFLCVLLLFCTCIQQLSGCNPSRYWFASHHPFRSSLLELAFQQHQ
jgi:hypothetical protein